jgi:sugar (pentulose or hexulose) kinase
VPDTGSIVRWFTERFADSDQAAAVVEGTTVYEIIDEKASGMPPGSDGLLCVPDEGGGAALVGLRQRHGRYHLYRALYEGMAFALREVLGGAESAGLGLPPLRVIGPGSASRLLIQIHADVCGLELEAMRPFAPDPARADVYEMQYARWTAARHALHDLAAP